MTKATYEYPSTDGVVRFRVVRTENADGKRFTQWRRADANSEWEAKSPEGLRPIYGLLELEWAEDGSAVLVVEGEKACHAARALFGDSLIVVTWAGGSNAVKRTDWEPLKRHRVAIMPDLDRKNYPDDHVKAGTLMPFMMQPGTKAALQVATLTGGALIDVPDVFVEAASWVVPSGWDLADPIPEGFTLSDIKKWVRAALEVAAGSIARSFSNEVGEQPASVSGEVLPADYVNGTDLQNVPDEMGVPDLIVNQNGTAKPLFENARRMLCYHDKFKLRFDLFSNRPMIGDIAIEDTHLMLISEWVQSKGVHASTNVIAEAVVAASLQRTFHPVLDYLDGLKWDGVNRLELWLIDHAEVEDDPSGLHRAMSAKYLIQAIARIRHPGCQADAMLILEGPQGYRKSSLLRSLFGAKWFSDHLPDLSQKDALVQLLGMWCIEVAEFATLGRADANKIKQFLTSPVDRYRPPYGKVAKDFPRSCVFAGTVNPGASGYLKDPTGGRRFWPMKVGAKINTDAVAAIRDHLWAEADARYKRGEQWWLTSDLLELAAADAQDERREEDVWEDKIGHFLIGRRRVTIGEILEHAIGLYKAGDWTTADQMRVGRALTALGWTRKQLREAGRRRWIYLAPGTENMSSAAYSSEEVVTNEGSGDGSGDRHDAEFKW